MGVGGGRRWWALTGRVSATHSLGDVPPGNGMALLLLVAVRLLAMRIHGCVNVCSGAQVPIDFTCHDWGDGLS